MGIRNLFGGTHDPARAPQDEAAGSTSGGTGTELEAGIAAILARLRDGEGPTDELPPPDPAVTAELLGELDRLWRKPAA